MPFGQTFSPVDLGTIGMLVILEGLLSIDNALVLGMLAQRVAPSKRAKALSYGLAGAVVFRLLAVVLATYLLRWSVLKLLGGLYLFYVAMHHLVFVRQTPTPDLAKVGALAESRGPDDPPPEHANDRDGRFRFWRLVLGIELADMAFGIDNVLAAIAMVGPSPLPRQALHPKLWVIITGGMMGVVLMRFAAAACAKLLKRYPRFDVSGYLIIALVAIKMMLEWMFDGRGAFDFQNPHGAAFWAFWITMIACLAAGFLPQHKSAAPLNDVSGSIP